MKNEKMMISIIAAIAFIIMIGLLLPKAFPLIAKPIENDPIEASEYHVTILDENTIILDSRSYPYDTIVIRMNAYKMIGEYVITVIQ